MGRFSEQLAHNVGSLPLTSIPVNNPDGIAFLVDNALLGSPANGVTYRRTPDLNDKDMTKKAAKFSSIVRGIPQDENWVKVGELYLPTRINGKRVLVPMLNDVYNLAPDEDREENKQAADVEKYWLHEESPVQGTGSMYEVMSDNVLIRAQPSQASNPRGRRRKGQEIELFEWDETKLWRRALCRATLTSGWSMLDHPEYGPLLRPIGEKFSANPLVPICVAAREGHSCELARFIDLGEDVNMRDVAGETPLMLASRASQLECCVLLLEAQADAFVDNSGDTAFTVAGSKNVLAVIQALTGSAAFDESRFANGLDSLSTTTREIAQRLFGEAASAKREKHLVDTETSTASGSTGSSKPSSVQDDACEENAIELS